MEKHDLVFLFVFCFLRKFKYVCCCLPKTYSDPYDYASEKDGQGAVALSKPISLS